MPVQQIQTRSARDMLRSATICVLFVAGLFFPTSVQTVFSRSLMGIAYGVCTMLLLLLFATTPPRRNSVTHFLPLFIVPLLLVFTFLSPLNSYTPGAIGPYILLTALFMLNVEDVQPGPLLRRLFASANLVAVVICFGIILGNHAIGDFIEAHYSAFYPELVTNMIWFHEPVLTFATHSLAGFFFYLLFYLNLRTFEVTRKSLYLALAACYIVFSLALISVTGWALASLAAAQLLWKGFARVRHKWLVAGTVVACALIVAAVEPAAGTYVDQVGKFVNAGMAVVTAPGRGFVGRWTTQGALAYDLHYLAIHPFSPVGITDHYGLMFADCGVLEHWLRGSVILVGLVYTGLFSFLKRNVAGTSDCYVLLAVILAFEVGFSSLTYFRTSYLLPFFIVYLNGLRQCPPAITALPVPAR